MMAAILNSVMLDSDTAILDSDTLLSSLRFTQKHSHSTLTLTQTNSIWLKLIHSHLKLDDGLNQLSLIQTHSWLNLILNSAILDSAIYSISSQTRWLTPSWIAIKTPCYLLSDSLQNTLTPLWLWLKLIQSDSNSFILTSTWKWQESWILSSWIPPSWIQPS